MEPRWSLTLLVLACGTGTYLWRGLGVWLADRVRTDGPWFRWISCVAYAMIAGLVCRLVLLPVGELEHASLLQRLIGVAVALIAFRLARANMLVGVLAGAAALPILGFLH